jgi:hypothetical protein
MSLRAIWSAPKARITGAVYLLYLIAVELAWVFVVSRPITCRLVLLASNILYIIVARLFYVMFEPVNRSLSLDAALFCVGGSMIGVLHIFGFETYIRAIGFLAVFSLLIGYLIVRSTFLPPFLGWLMVISGAGWVAFLNPSIAKYSHGHMSHFSFLVEGLLALWLLVKGVDMERWREQCAVAEAISAK